MYVEGADTPGSETDSHDAAHMEVEVSAGHEQSLELNSDADHDGHADHMVQLDENGHVTGTAHFDTGTHSWVADDQSASSLGSNAEHASGLVVETDHGNVVAGPATVDLNHDGRADTAIVHDDQG